MDSLILIWCIFHLLCMIVYVSHLKYMIGQFKYLWNIMIGQFKYSLKHHDWSV